MTNSNTQNNDKRDNITDQKPPFDKPVPVLRDRFFEPLPLISPANSTTLESQSSQGGQNKK